MNCSEMTACARPAWIWSHSCLGVVKKCESCLGGWSSTVSEWSSHLHNVSLSFLALGDDGWTLTIFASWWDRVRGQQPVFVCMCVSVCVCVCSFLSTWMIRLSLTFYWTFKLQCELYCLRADRQQTVHQRPMMRHQAEVSYFCSSVIKTCTRCVLLRLHWIVHCVRSHHPPVLMTVVSLYLETTRC